MDTGPGSLRDLH